MKFKDLKERVTTSWQAQAKFRRQFETDRAFFDGHQWDGDDKSQMEDDSKMALTFNRTAVIINSVVGSEINNRMEVRFIPREIGDVKVNEVLTSGAEWFRDASMAEDAESEAFEDLLIGGLGWTETGLDWDEDPEGEPSTERIDPLEMGWDSTAKKKGLKDSDLFFRVRTMSKRRAVEQFRGVRPADIDADWIQAAADAEETRNEIGDEYKGPSEGDTATGKDQVTVVQVQWCETANFVEYVDPDTGQKTDIPQDRFNEIIDRIGAPPGAQRSFTRKVWRQAFLGKSKIIRQNQPCRDQSTFTPITGIWDPKEGLFYGLLASMRDPQMYANKWLSEALHIMRSNSKGGVMVEEGAVDDYEEFEESWAKADAVSYVKDGGIANGRIVPKPAAQLPSSYMQLTEFAVSSIRDASGVNMELLGLRDANQPGILEHQRRQSAMTTLARFFDALRFYRKRQGEVILHFLRDHIAPTGRLVRILRDGQQQYVPLALQEDTRRYDVIVDDAPQSPNEKERVWGIIQAMLPLLQQATQTGQLGMSDWADIMEFSPLPSAIVEKLRSKAEQAQQDTEGQQMAKAEKMAEIEKTKSEAAENMAEAQYDQARAQQVVRQLAGLIPHTPF